MSEKMGGLDEARAALAARFEDTWRRAWNRDPLKSQIEGFIKAEVDAAVKVAREDAEANAKRAEAAEAEVSRLRGMMDRAVPYITQTGLGAAIYEAVKREARATPAERAAAGLAPEAPAQPQVIPGSLNGFPWDADWSRVIDGDAVIAGGRKITFRVEPFRADPHPATAPADGSAARFDEAIAAFDRARAEWREAIKQPQVLPEHLAYIEALADAQPYSWNTAESGPSKVCLAGRALRAAVARRDGAKGGS